MVYVGDTIHCSEIQWQDTKDLESIGLNMILAPQMLYELIVRYRPPSSNIAFCDKFREMLCQCDFKKEIILMGDFNLKWEESLQGKDNFKTAIKNLNWDNLLPDSDLKITSQNFTEKLQTKINEFSH